MLETPWESLHVWFWVDFWSFRWVFRKLLLLPNFSWALPPPHMQFCDSVVRAHCLRNWELGPESLSSARESSSWWYLFLRSTISDAQALYVWDFRPGMKIDSDPSYLSLFPNIYFRVMNYFQIFQCNKTTPNLVTQNNSIIIIIIILVLVLYELSWVVHVVALRQMLAGSGVTILSCRWQWSNLSCNSPWPECLHVAVHMVYTSHRMVAELLAGPSQGTRLYMN